MKFYFCGIGGIGMSSIAQYLKFKGHCVCGSDRAFDLKDNQMMRQKLASQGIEIYPQDGSGVLSDIDIFVVSTAVEETILDVKEARKLGLRIKKRAEILADILHEYEGVAVGGTSGKTTITAMIGHILSKTGRKPVVINGGISVNTYNGKEPSNLIFGEGKNCIIEADESDGTIELYAPFVSVVSNISLDHKPIVELKKLFLDFVKRTQKGVVLNLDCPYTAQMRSIHPNTITFSLEDKEATLYAENIRLSCQGVDFEVQGHKVHLPLLGRHNIANALSAIGVCLHLGVGIAESAQVLGSFLGTKRRLEKIGCCQEICVFDDYAHNPAKILASLKTVGDFSSHLFAVFQPHGFGPTRLMKEDLIKSFIEGTRAEDILLFPEIFYQGGTVAKDISSRDLVKALMVAGRQAYFFEKREEIPQFIATRILPKDNVVVMGARDGTLTNLAKDILSAIETAVKEKQ